MIKIRRKWRSTNDAEAGTGHLTRERALILLAILISLLVLAVLAALVTGSEEIPGIQLLHALSSAVVGMPSRLTPEQETILFQIRLPRVGLAIGVGAALALSGAAFQSLLRNPLADPYVLGISGGAAVGSMMANILFPGYGSVQMAGGFIGAGLAMTAVYQIGRRKDDPAHLVLAGVIMSTMLSSFIVLMTALADSLQLRRITLWLLGDLSTGTGSAAIFVLVVSLLAGLVLTGRARALNLMMIGERDAFALGIETTRVRWQVYLMASLLTAAAVTAGGAIGYVGLVVPHLIRLAAGADNRLVIPASAIGGAILVLIADMIARTVIAPRELPTGAIIALLGAPVFLFLLIRGRR